MEKKKRNEPAPDTATVGFWRIWDVLNVIPVCATDWWNGCRSGIYPTPYKIGPNKTGWKKTDIIKLADSFLAKK